MFQTWEEVVSRVGGSAQLEHAIWWLTVKFRVQKSRV